MPHAKYYYGARGMLAAFAHLFARIFGEAQKISLHATCYVHKVHGKYPLRTVYNE